MSSRIARLLDEPEQRVSKLLGTLEDKNGYPSQDARFLAETSQKIRSKLTDLGLDPDDTTGEELYEALNIRFEKDSRAFDDYFNAEDMDFNDRTAKTAILLNQYAELPQIWGLKNKAAKDIIRQLPPKQTMKRLNYRSVESFLKRESLAEIYLAAGYAESESWQKKHRRLVFGTDQTAFEIKNMSVQTLDFEKWGDIGGPDEFVAKNDEIAAIGIWPSDQTKEAPLLSLVLLLADALSFNVKASRTAASLNGIVTWWADMDHLVAELAGEHVSLSLKDRVLNHLLNNDFAGRSLYHGRLSFWRELVSRYENLPDSEPLPERIGSVKSSRLDLKAPEPAYEFAENI